MKKILLILIVVLAFVLRFYQLDSYPALNADEAAIGYNAYSLIQTGKDEHGNPWPIHFQSFNDYKPGLYFYLVLPFVKVMGLNEWAVRIPGATLGVLTVLVLYFLVKELFKNEKLALISAFFLSISPWHIHFSRGGWEVNAATFFITVGVWLFLKGLKNPKLMAISFISFVASLYTYHAARIAVPLLGLSLIIFNWGEIKKNLKIFIILGLIASIFLFPLVIDLTKGSITSRAAGVGLFADLGPFSRINEQRGEHNDFSGLIAKVIHNKPVNYGLAFLGNWTKHFWGEFLFLSGDEIQRNKVPETGQMYLFDFIFIVIGFIFIAKNFKTGWKIVFSWLLIAPLASALTFQSPHALRAQNMVIPLVIISAYGLTSLLSLIKEKIKIKNLERVIWGIIGLLILWNFGRYLHMYYIHMAKEYPYSSQYGLKELVSYVKENGERFEKIIVTNRYDQPYILFLFYLKYPPAKFQAEHTLTGKDNYGFSTVPNFGKYYFGEINFSKTQPENPNSLIVGTDEEIPKEANIIKDIYGTNGYRYFRIVAN